MINSDNRQSVASCHGKGQYRMGGKKWMKDNNFLLKLTGQPSPRKNHSTIFLLKVLHDQKKRNWLKKSHVLRKLTLESKPWKQRILGWEPETAIADEHPYNWVLIIIITYQFHKSWKQSNLNKGFFALTKSFSIRKVEM